MSWSYGDSTVWDATSTILSEPSACCLSVAGLKVLTGQGTLIDTTTAAGRLSFGIFAALAEFAKES